MRAGILVLTAALSVCGATDELTARGIHNFHQVDAHVYRGGQPSTEGLKSLAKMGIKTIVDLREPGERGFHEKAAVEALGMRYVSVPMAGMRAPTNDQVDRVLKMLDTSGSADWPVFVHCRRGADRTGTIIACYRIEHDHWDGQKAVAEAKVHGMSRWEWAMKLYILHFRPSEPQKNQPGLPAALQSAAR